MCSLCFSRTAVIYQVLSPAHLSHTSLLIRLDHFANQTVMKYSNKSHTNSAGTRSFSRVETARRNNQTDAWRAGEAKVLDCSKS